MADQSQENKKTQKPAFAKASAGKQENTDVPSTCPHCAEYKAGWQRAVADYQNLQKETARQRSEWAQMSEIQILQEFIPVYDNFKKAFVMEQGARHYGSPGETLAKQGGQARNKEQESWAKGIEFIMKQFGEVLKGHGVEEIKTAGEQFDPALHEIVGEEETEAEEGTIVKEIESGYRKNGKVLKVAKVVVAKKTK